MRILSSASNHHVVLAYHGSFKSLRESGVMVEHTGIPTDWWYAGNATQAYHALGWPTCAMPRPSGRQTPFWLTKDAGLEMCQALRTVDEFLSRLIEQHRPQVFLMADDTGLLELFMLRKFVAAGVAVVLLEHGYGFATSQELRLPLRLKLSRALRSLAKSGIGVLRDAVFLAGGKGILDNRAFLALLSASCRSFGRNGPATICGLSQFTKPLLVKHGVARRRICDTGYPYWDNVYAQRIDRMPRPVQPRPKILLVSTGSGLFGCRELAESYFRLLIRIIEQLQPYYSVAFRLKPGEDLALQLNRDTYDRLHGLQLNFDDNKRNSYEAVGDFDLVMGEASTVLQEAVIVGVPALLLKTDDPAVKWQRYTMESLLQEFMGVMSLGRSDDLLRTVRRALEPAYLASLTGRLQAQERFLFNGLDGHAGARVAAVIQQVVSALSIPKCS